MYHCVPVPDFQMDDDYSIPSSNGVARPRKSSLHEDEVMELLWQNGQVVMHSQNQRSTRRSPLSKYDDAVLPAEQSAAREIRSEQVPATHNQHNQDPQLFMQEDEMASWLHYPLVDDDPALDHTFCADLLYPSNNLGNSNSTNPTVRTNGVSELHPAVTSELGTSLPPIPPTRRTELGESKVQNFMHFSRHKAKVAGGERLDRERLDQNAPSSSRSAAGVRESTVVDSSETPAVGYTLHIGDRDCAAKNGDASAGTSSAGGGGVSGVKEMSTCDVTVSSSPGCSSASASAEPALKPQAEDRKRKGREANDTECHSEDVEFESVDTKKQARGSTTTKRSRAAEVHNLSERRRRDRINEKMRALQELIPRCNKSDKASMLDEAIEYLKSLQLQVQMMSMGCGMVPMMFPGVQQYMPAMGMGIGMGMGMGMEMGINRPMMPFPNMLAGSSLPTPSAAAHLRPRFPLPAFHMLPVPGPDPSRMQAANQSEQMLNSLGAQLPSQSRFPNFVDPYQQYVATHQMQVPLPQNEALAQPSSSKPRTNKGPQNLDNRQ